MWHYENKKIKKKRQSRNEKRKPMYRGVRRRKWGKWVSEIRQPGTKIRIWLGSYDKPEMAALAYDVAAVSLKGKLALPNFPDLIQRLPRPVSLNPTDIQHAAAQAALAICQQSDSERPRHSSTVLSNVGESMEAGGIACSDEIKESAQMNINVEEADDGLPNFCYCRYEIDDHDEGSSVNLRIRMGGRDQCSCLIDEELQQLDSPNLVMNMAEALLLTPPRLDDHQLEMDDYYGLDNCDLDPSAAFGTLWSSF